MKNYSIYLYTCFSLLLSFIVTNLLGQQDTLFITENGQQVPRENASCYRIYSITDSLLFKIEDFYWTHKPKRICYSKTPNATILESMYWEYDEAGNTIRKGMFEKGFEVGEWNYYFSNSKNPKEKRNYKGKHTYYVYQYDSMTHKLEHEGYIDRFNNKDGIWKQYHYYSDSLKLKSNFRSGKKDGEQIEYYKSGSIKRVEQFKMGKFLKGKLLNENGEKEKYYPAFVYPTYGEFVGKYLRRKTPCYSESLKDSECTLSFMVNKDGSLTDIQIKNVSDPSCKKEFLQHLSQMKKWKPALLENKPINFRYTITLKY